MSSQQFKVEITKEMKQVVNEVNDAISKTGIYGWNLVVTATPVLTGRARASWLLNLDQASEVTERPSKSKSRVYPDPKEPTIAFELGTNQALIISNNVEYIEHLEEGTDKCIPFAMVAESVPKINNELNRRLKKIK